jgi:N-acetylmuramoyl-L-alanine amidase CwlA
VPLYERSAASNSKNKNSISIEVCHPDSSGKFNDETYNSLIKLVSFLCDKFSLDENDIIRHYDITGKICPKYYVENEDAWETFKRDVKESLDED